MRGKCFLTALICIGTAIGGWAQQHLSLNPSFLFDEVSESNLPKRAGFRGDFVASKKWEDKGGTNFFIVSSVDLPEEFRKDLYVYQYAVKDGQTTLVWDIKDFPPSLCDAFVVGNSLQILDLDGDGYMETSFIYQFGCDGLDPRTTKLMLHTRGEKLALRGTIPWADEPEEGYEKGEKNFDPAVAGFPVVFRNFMSREWDEFVQAEGFVEYARFVKERHPKFILMGKEYLVASGGTEYELLDANGSLLPLSKENLDLVRYATDLRFMPEGQHLYLASLPKIGLLDLEKGTFEAWVSLYEDTEGLSPTAWSPSQKKLAFVTLNMEKYPEKTRIFVLGIDGSKLMKKQKYDVAAEFMVAATYSLSPVTFEGENNIRFRKKHPDPGQRGSQTGNISLE